jgi:hypothetical protein
MSKTLNSEDFTLDDVYHILDMVEDSDYTYGTVGSITYHNFNVHAGETVSFGEDDVFVGAGFHQLALNAHTAEWIAYNPPLPPNNSYNEQEG